MAHDRPTRRASYSTQPAEREGKLLNPTSRPGEQYTGRNRPTRGARSWTSAVEQKQRLCTTCAAAPAGK